MENRQTGKLVIARIKTAWIVWIAKVHPIGAVVLLFGECSQQHQLVVSLRRKLILGSVPLGRAMTLS